LSCDARYELPYHVSVFTQVGRAKSIADSRQMWNSMYGVSIADLWSTGIHADYRYARFASSFGQGNYQAVSLGRNLRGNLQIDLLAGTQSLVSAMTQNTSSRFLSTSTSWN